MMDVQILEDIGLTHAEIKVYLALLELGSATAGPLIEKAALQSSVVHATLNKLINKGLVSSILEGKRRSYQPSDPKHIVSYIEEKRERYEQLLPELLLRQRLAKVKPEVVTFRGVRGIRELLYELLDAGGSEHHTFGSTQKSLMMGDAWWVQYHKRRAEKKIRAKLLFNESLASWKAEKKYPLAHVRYTKKGFEPLTETIIRNEKIGLIIWTDIPIGVLVHQPEAARSYDAFFTVLWNAAS
jgi:sugar-specific transcriptional regulator TrmB